MTKKNILIAGGSGLIGSHLCTRLEKLGYQPIILTTSSTNVKKNMYHWHIGMQYHDLLPDGEYVAVINLAGASIADTPWNKKGKALIYSSRIASTNYLASIIKILPNAPQHVISASAVGYYGFTEKSPRTEESAAGKDFAAHICEEWEKAAQNLAISPTQLSIIRIGIVMAKAGGFYQKIKQLASFKIAAPLGSGKQIVPWIHISDLSSILVDIIENRLKPGTYNAVCDNHSNREVTAQIAKTNQQPWIWPAIPGIFLRLIFGKKAEILIKSSPISNSKLLKNGFEFKFKDLNSAISNIEQESSH